MPAPAKILDLVERFDRNLHTYKHGPYNEAQARIAFIGPFFTALGWDMGNAQGCTETYRDVILIGGRLGGEEGGWA